jgi:hypothetical protein
MGDILWRDTSGNTAIWFINGLPAPSRTLIRRMNFENPLCSAPRIHGEMAPLESTKQQDLC